MISPLFTIAYISLSNRSLQQTAPVWIAMAALRSYRYSRPSRRLSHSLLLSNLCCFLRCAWQRPLFSLLDVAVAGSLMRLVDESSSWAHTPLTIQLMLIGFIHLRLDEFIAKMKFMITVSQMPRPSPRKQPSLNHVKRGLVPRLPSPPGLSNPCGIHGAS